jgi:His-Xaa-Ser repeat protein HxsA
MRRNIKALSLAVATAFSISSKGANPDEAELASPSEGAAFGGLMPSSRLLNSEVPLFLAQHRSHSSHGSHGSHRSSSPTPTPRYRSPVPSPAPAQIPAPTPPPAPKADPLGQESKPQQTYNTKANDDSRLIDNKELKKRVISRVQINLQLLGYYSGAIDGVLGPLTRSAIDIFKIENGLPMGSYLDTETLNAIGISIDDLL